MKVLIITGKLAEKEVRKYAKGCDVYVVDVDVAAFITPAHIRHLNLEDYDLVLVPGLTKGCDWKKLEEEKANYLRERERVARNISQSLLKRYEFIRQRRGGLAVVGVENGTCEGCHMNIPPQLFNDLQRDDRYFECPLCRRLIYYKKLYFPEDVEDSTDNPPSE